MALETSKNGVLYQAAVAHTFYLSTWEAEECKSLRVQVTLLYTVSSKTASVTL